MTSTTKDTMSIIDRLPQWNALARAATPDIEHDRIVTCHEDIFYVAGSQADAELCVEARDALLGCTDALGLLAALHTPVTLWCLRGGTVSYESHDDALAAADGDELLSFELCRECRRIEDGPSGKNAGEVDYGTSLWPCKTALILIGVPHG